MRAMDMLECSTSCHARASIKNVSPDIYLMQLAVKKPLVLAAAGLITLINSECLNAAPVTLRCTNPASGAVWDIKIDYQNATADSFPAKISGERIKWHNVLHGGYYEFNRRSGDLTVVYASSTGGFTLRDKCRFLEDVITR